MSDRRRELPVQVRELIIKLWNEGKTMRDIGNTIGKPHATVQRIINNFKEKGNVLTKPRSGRPKALNDREERAVIRMVKVTPKITAPKIAIMVSTPFKKNISSKTVQNILKRAGYRGCVARKKPFISKVNKAKQLQFANEHIAKPQEF